MLSSDEVKLFDSTIEHQKIKSQEIISLNVQKGVFSFNIYILVIGNIEIYRAWTNRTKAEEMFSFAVRDLLPIYKHTKIDLNIAFLKAYYGHTKKKKSTMLHFAVEQNIPDIIELFITLSLTKNCKGFTPLMLAADLNRFECWKVLLDASNKETSISAIMQNLLWMCSDDKLCTHLKYFLTHDLESAKPYLYLGLETALQSNSVDAVILLLNEGYDLSLDPFDHHTRLFDVISDENLSLTDISKFKYRPHENVFHLAAKIGNYQLLELLFSRTKIQHRYLWSFEADGNKPIDILTENCSDDTEIVKTLKLFLDRGVNPTEKAVINAFKHNSIKSLELFFEYFPVYENSLLYRKCLRECEDKENKCFINILKQGIELNPDIDSDEMPPLHQICKNNFACLTRILIIFGADFYRRFDGYTPYEIALIHRSKECVDLLREIGGHTTSKNFLQNYSDSDIAFVKNDSISVEIIKQFESLSIKTYLDLAQLSDKCRRKTYEICELNIKEINFLEDFLSQKFSLLKNGHFKYSKNNGHCNCSSKKINILCLDGGGIRGLTLVEILSEIERRTQHKIHELFQYICGTSTGGLLACAIGLKKLSLSQCRGIYMNFASTVFKGNRLYDRTPFVKIMKQVFGDAKMMNEVESEPKLRVSCLAADVSAINPDLFLFRNYLPVKNNARRINGTSTSTITDALCATSAAPTYFDSFECVCDGSKLQFFDGGLLHNNPTSVALSETSGEATGVVLSVGTGYEADRKVDLNFDSIKNVDIASIKFARMMYNRFKTQNLSDIFTLFKNTVVASDVDIPVFESWVNIERNGKFFRFQPCLGDFYVEIDEIEDEALLNLCWHVKKYVYSNSDQFDELCCSLINNI